MATVGPLIASMTRALDTERMLGTVAAQMTRALDTERMAEALSGRENEIILTRDQQRFVFGWYIYCVVQALMLAAVLKIMSANEPDTAILSLMTMVTGLSGHKIAVMARDAAWRIFDYMYPP